MKHMRVALLHDYLNQFGGAERVLQALLELFPKADIYTLLYDRERTFGLFDRNIVRTSFLDTPFVHRHHRAFIPCMPLASRALTNKKGKHYDLVVSSTAGYAKGFGVTGTYHLSYCHSPLRYAWEAEYLRNLPNAPWMLREMVMEPIAEKLRAWDMRAAERVNTFVANSRFTGEKVSSYYHRDAQVIYPPVAHDIFYPESTDGDDGYYLMAGRLLYYKCFDLGIKAFSRLKKPLKIVGKGPEERKLRARARSSNIEFITDATDEKLRALYSRARALIFPQIEDFGLAAAEAQSCGTPVLAYHVGGGAEIVRHKRTGLLFYAQTPEAIEAAVHECESTHFDRKAIAADAQRFSKERFLHEMRGVVRSLGFSVAG